MGQHAADGSQAAAESRAAGDSQAIGASQATKGGQRLYRRGVGVEDIVQRLRTEAPWNQRIVHWHEEAAREGRTAEFPSAVDARLLAVLKQKGVERPYKHQAQAIQAALDGQDVLISTPTASGKTICYTVPVLQSLLESEGAARALFLFPTKALSQDQTAGITALVEGLDAPWHAFTYDGDTPPSVRRSLRDRGHLIMTNPWMLHQGILPNHAKWAELFRDLRYIVVDEVHTLSGVFGSSVSNVLRRLLRIAHHYGSQPRFIASSATLQDAAGHARRLFGRDFTVVDQDASPAGPRYFGVYNPPMVNAVAGMRANALEEARKLATVVCSPGHQVIFFCGRRTAVEVLTRYLKEAAPKLGLKPDEIRGYRGGYLPLMRREIESGLKSGEVKVVVSTNALELGIDIGSLDVAVLVGYPGSQASFWQRAGRVGRRGSSSLVVQIARSDPVDQYLVHHPRSLFQASRERLGLDPDNLVILSEQLKCAAFELPFKESEEGGLAKEAEYGQAPFAVEILDYLAEESGFLHKRNRTWYWMADAYPAKDVTLKGNEPDNVVILEQGTEKALGEIDREGSITSVHEGAIYLVEGETWRIEKFDYKNRRAYARRVDSDYFTDAHTDKEVRVLRLEARRQRTREEAPVEDPWSPSMSGDAVRADSATSRNASSDDPENVEPENVAPEDYEIWRGEVHVTTVATLYKKIRFYTRENLGAGNINLPAEELDTEAFILTLSEASSYELGLSSGDRGAAWRAVGSLIRRVAPLFVRCQPGDLGISTHIKSPHFGRPTIFLYDRVQGGVGLGELIFQDHRSLLRAALEVLEHCECQDGCPACVGPLAEVGPYGKDTARRLLAHLAQGVEPSDTDLPCTDEIPAERIPTDKNSASRKD